MRKVSFELGVQKHADGSVLVSFGDTRVICAASLQEKVPGWLKGRGQGWMTAEYAMLPQATNERTERDGSRGKANARSLEIQRLIGRALRGVCDLKALGERTLTIDCDVLQADGGTRTASITGAYVAAMLALRKHKIKALVLKEPVAAVSIGICAGQVSVDLCYTEDSTADVDLNLVMTQSGKIVEVQGTAEGEPFAIEQLMQMVDAGKKAIGELVKAQLAVLG